MFEMIEVSVEVLVNTTTHPLPDTHTPTLTKMFVTFAALTTPASSMAKSACMKKTSIPMARRKKASSDEVSQSMAGGMALFRQVV